MLTYTLNFAMFTSAHCDVPREAHAGHTLGSCSDRARPYAVSFLFFIFFSFFLPPPPSSCFVFYQRKKSLNHSLHCNASFEGGVQYFQMGGTMLLTLTKIFISLFICRCFKNFPFLNNVFLNTNFKKYSLQFFFSIFFFSYFCKYMFFFTIHGKYMKTKTMKNDGIFS